MDNKNLMKVKIVGVGHYLPSRAIKNDEVEKYLGLSKGSIAKTSAGVTSRRWADPVKETTTIMGALALKEAVKDADKSLEDLDLIISAGGSTERKLPDQACLIQQELGLQSTPCFHVHTTCLSWMNAFQIASSFLETGVYKTIGIVASEMPSSGLNCKSPESCIIFGDGAAATVIERTPDDEKSCMHSFKQITWGAGADLTTFKGAGSARPPRNPLNLRQVMDPVAPVTAGSDLDNVFYMDGSGAIKFLIKKFHLAVSETYAPLIKEKDRGGVTLVIPHQPSGKALELMAKIFGWSKIMVNIIEDTGNLMAASIPLAIYRAVKCKRLKRGDKAFVAGVGAGMHYAGFILEY